MGDYLFARPTALEGYARTIDLFGSLNTYNVSKSAKEADERAIREDIKALRNDMQNAISGVIYG